MSNVNSVHADGEEPNNPFELENDTYISDWSTAYNYSTITSGGVTTVSITSPKYSDLYHYTIPAYINGYKVTSIGNRAFRNNDSVRTVYFQSDDGDYYINSINSYAFYDCDNLKILYCDKYIDGELTANKEEFALPSSISSIGSYAFAYCRKLGSYKDTFYLSEELIDIDEYAFAWCYELRKVNLRDTNVERIDNYAFYQCTVLSSINFPSTLYYLGEQSFEYCYKLDNVDLSNTSVESICYYTFAWSSDLKTLTLPNTLENIFYGAFVGTDIDDLVLPNSVTYIANYILPSSLKNLTLPQEFYIIPTSACYDSWYNSNDTAQTYDLRQQKQTFKYGYVVFSDLFSGRPQNMESISFHGGESEQYAVVDGILYTSDLTEIVYCPTNNPITALTIPSSVTTIQDYAFYYNKNITTITFGNNVKYVGNYAFARMESLTSIVMNESTLTLGDSCFRDNQSLASVNLPTNITSSYKYYYLTYSRSYSNSRYKYNYYWSEQSTTGNYYLFCNCDSITSITIPDNWTYIPYYMFQSCEGLESVSFGSNITEIRSGAFNNCTSLTQISSLENVHTIDSSAFSYCTSLAQVSNLTNIRKIGSNAFSNCESLTSLYFGEYLNDLSNTFEYDSGITDIYIHSDNSYYSSIDGVVLSSNDTYLYHMPSGKTGDYVIPASVTTIGKYAFYYSKLSSVDWSSDKIVKISDYAFQNSSIEGEIAIGYNHMMYVGPQAFYECKNLTKVKIGPLLESIENNTFGYCNHLAEVVFETQGNLTIIKDNAFSNTKIVSFVLPEGLITATNILGTYWGSVKYYSNLTLPSTIKYYQMQTWNSGWESYVGIEDFVISEGVEKFNVEKLSTSDSYKYIYLADFTTLTLPTTLTKMADIKADTYSVIKISGSVTNGTRDSILIPTNCEFRGKVLVPEEDFDLYYNSSYWADNRSRLVTTLESVVTFSNSMGSSFDSVTVEYGGTVANPGTPSCEDYPTAIFKGWFWDNPKNHYNTELFDFETQIYFDVNLYAKWGGIPADEFLEYELNEDGETYTITGYLEEINDFEEVVIPMYHPGDNGVITNIAPHAFEKARFTGLIFMPGNNITIGKCAFMNCPILKTLDLTGVAVIGDNAFMHDRHLLSLTIPASVKYVGSNAFSYCMRLKTVIWESGPNPLCGDSLGFVDENGNIGVNLNDVLGKKPNVGSIYYKAYQNNTHTYEYETNLFEHIFVNCYALESVSLPSNMYVVPDRMFDNCTKLTSVTLGSGTYRINSRSFANCPMLASITLPNNLHEIGNFAFENSGITSITIPANVNEIGYNPFLNCENLQSIEVDPLNSKYATINSVLVYLYEGTGNDRSYEDISIISVPYKIITPKMDFNSFIAPNTKYFTIYRYALAYNDVIQHVVFPKVNYITIDAKSFYSCSKLSVVAFNSPKVNFSDWVDHGQQFYDCPSLSIIMFGEDLVYAPTIRNGNFNVFNQQSDKLIIYATSASYNLLSNSAWSVYELIEVDSSSSDIYVVIFDLNGGSGVNAVVVQQGQAIIVADPTKVGYRFVAWYSDSNFVNEFDLQSGVDENIILYAKWDLLSYTLTYHWNGGALENTQASETTDVTYHITDVADENYEPVSYTLLVPSRYGFTFVGWYLDEDFTTAKYSSININDLNITQLEGINPLDVYARWEKITYQLNIQSDDDKYLVGLSVDSTNPVGHGSNVNFTLIFKDGYTQNTPENLVLVATNLSTSQSSELEAWDNNGIWYYTIEDVQSAYNVTVSGVITNTYLVSFVSQPVEVSTNVSGMPQNITITHGSSIQSILSSALSTPSRLGYDFAGWFAQRFDNITGTILYDDFQYDFNEPVTNTLTISASWDTIEYNLSLVMNGGTLGSDSTAVQTIPYTIESAFLLPYNTEYTKNVTRTGYTFGGWFEDPQFSGDELTQIVKGTAHDTVAYAKWIPITYTIQYYLNGGVMESDSYPTTYTIEDSIVLPSAVRGGYTFDGWFEMADLSGSSVDSIPLGTIGRKSFYAKWLSNVYNINYYLNGNIYSQVTIDNIEVSYTSNYYRKSYVYNQTTQLVSNIKRTGYTFVGWYEDSNFEGTPIAEIPQDRIDDVTVYAKWTAVQYTINFNYNDQEKNNQDPPQTPIGIISYTYTYDILATNHGQISVFDSFDMNDEVEWDMLHNFVGWFDDITSGNRFTSINVDNITSSNMTLYAHWVNSVYDLFVFGGTNVELADNQVTDIVKIVGASGDFDKVYGSGLQFMVVITNPAYTQSNISVDYMIGSGTLTPATYNSSTGYYVISDAINDDLSLYINNLIINTYTVKFNSVGGTNVSTITNVKHGTILSQPSTIPQKAGYTFEKWLIEGTSNNMDWNTAIVGDINLFASYNLITYNVRIMSGVQTDLVIQTLQYDVEHHISLNTTVINSVPNEPGYVFDHFEYNGDVVVDTQGLIGDVDVIATYQVVTYNISYTVDSGYTDPTNPYSYSIDGVNYLEEVGDEYVSRSASSVVLKPASKQNYDFKGWFYAGVEVQSIPFQINGKIEYNNLVLVARFALSSDAYREVNFYDGTRLLSAVSVLENESVNSITAPDKEGYTNTNLWYTDSNFYNLYDFSTPVTTNINLYIKYTLIDYRITYNYSLYDDNYKMYTSLSASNIINSNSVRYNVENDVMLQDVSKPGYNFDGWYLDDNLVNYISYSLNGNIGNISLVARFSYVTYQIVYSIEEGAQNNSANPTTFKIDDEVIELEGAIPMTDYHFVKWVLTTDINTDVSSIDPSTGHNYYLSAVFDINKFYVYINLYIEENGEITKYSELQNEKGTLLTPPTRPRSGYTLDAWYKDSLFTSKFNFDNPTNEDLDLYGRYETVKYRINYASNLPLSSTNPMPSIRSYTCEDRVEIPALLNEVGYTFAGWYTGVGLVDDEYDFSSAVEFNGYLINSIGDVNLVAKFTENVYTIVYKLDGATNSDNNPETITYNTPSITLEAPQKTGYTFDYWTRELSNGEEEIIRIIPTHSTENYVLKANFTKIKETLVVSRRVWRSDVLYAFSDDVVSLSNGRTFVENTTPTYEGYTFDKWYQDVECTVLFNFNMQYTEDLVMYGKFLPKEYTITYLYNVATTQNPTNPTTYKYKSQPFVLVSPNRVPGYAFEAWYVGAELTDAGYDFTNATRVTSIGDENEDIEIVGKFVLETYKVNYHMSVDGAENNPSNPTTFTILDKGLQLFDPISPEGYIFTGWFDTLDRQYSVIPEGYSADLDLTAKFSEITEGEKVDTNRIVYILIGVGGVGIFFVSVIFVVIANANKRKAIDAKRISALVSQINDVVNKRK